MIFFSLNSFTFLFLPFAPRIIEANWFPLLTNCTKGNTNGASCSNFNIVSYDDLFRNSQGNFSITFQPTSIFIML